jgi:outer membrane protein TolC
MGSFRLRSTSLLPNEANPLAGSGFGDLFGLDALSFRVGPNISLPLFDFGLREHQAKAAESQFQQALDGYRMAVWQAIEEVENADSQLLFSLQRVGYLQQSAEAYEKALHIAKIRYQEGESGFQAVLDTQRAVVMQHQNLAAELGNIALAQINLFKALGGSWWSDASDYINSSKGAEQNDAINDINHD